MRPTEASTHSVVPVKGTAMCHTMCHAREREHPRGHVRSQKGVALVRVPFLERGATLGERTYFVYIMASRRNGTLYVGLTNNLALRAPYGRRIDLHDEILLQNAGLVRAIWRRH
jgi:hypothetical protein